MGVCVSLTNGCVHLEQIRVCTPITCSRLSTRTTKERLVFRWGEHLRFSLYRMNKCIKNKKMYTSEYSVFLSVRRLFTCIGRCHTEDGKLARLAICVGNHPLSKATAHFLILTSLNANDDIKSALITCLHYLSTRPMSRAADAILVDHVRRRPNSATTYKQDN